MLISSGRRRKKVGSSLKIRFLDIFFETAHQICLKIGQNLEIVALNH